MEADRIRILVLGLVGGLLVLGMVGPVVASPAPITACPPCGSGFSDAAGSHGLDTDVRHGAATVRVHRNGSASWTVRVVPTNGTVLTHLAANRSLARSVARDSFGTRYGDGIDHELLAVAVENDTFVMRYVTHGVVEQGPFGTSVLTYFRDSPGAYIYTGLGADELTVIGPNGTTVARGFGDDSGNRMTATELPDARNGPFVVFAPAGSVAPGAMGHLAVTAVLWDVIVRNLLYFVVLPGGVLVGGLAAIRRAVDANPERDPGRLGSLVAGGGVLMLAGTAYLEGNALPVVTSPLLIGGFGGALLVALGAGVADFRGRRHLTGRRLVGAGIALGLVAAIVVTWVSGESSFLRVLALGAALPPVVVGLGWLDAEDRAAERPRTTRLFGAVSVVFVGVLAVFAPLTALGGPFFILVPLLLTLVAAGFVVGALPLYALGAAGAGASAPGAGGR